MILWTLFEGWKRDFEKPSCVTQIQVTFSSAFDSTNCPECTSLKRRQKPLNLNSAALAIGLCAEIRLGKKLCMHVGEGPRAGQEKETR